MFEVEPISLTALASLPFEYVLTKATPSCLNPLPPSDVKKGAFTYPAKVALPFVAISRTCEFGVVVFPLCT